MYCTTSHPSPCLFTFRHCKKITYDFASFAVSVHVPSLQKNYVRLYGSYLNLVGILHTLSYCSRSTTVLFTYETSPTTTDP